MRPQPTSTQQYKSTQITKGIIPTAKNNHDQPKLQDVINTTFNMSDPIHQRDISQSTLVSIKFISYFNSHFNTSIVIVTHEPFAFTPREQGKYSLASSALEAVGLSIPHH